MALTGPAEAEGSSNTTWPCPGTSCVCPASRLSRSPSAAQSALPSQLLPRACGRRAAVEPRGCALWVRSDNLPSLSAAGVVFTFLM